MFVPFNNAYVVGTEFDYIRAAIEGAHLAGDGPFSSKCHSWLKAAVGCPGALLVHSGTGALEMAAILAGVEPGDEIIMPSYTFVTTATAFVLRGGVPVFVDIRPDTLNLDETLLEAAITKQTKAIVVVHYAGISCEMDAIMDIARRHGLIVVEDAAQAIMCSYKGRPLGGIGDLGALSFHETKNVTCGEGGALLVNNPADADRAEIIWQKGTNRSDFSAGKADKYTWVDIGSSFLPSEINAAFLWAQFEAVEQITARRLAIWNRYHEAFICLEESGTARRPCVPEHCSHGAHMYYLLLTADIARSDLLAHMNEAGVNAVFHYVPLHSSPAGRKAGRVAGEMTTTDIVSSRIIRLPLWPAMSDEQVTCVIEVTQKTMWSMC